LPPRERERERERRRRKEEEKKEGEACLAVRRLIRAGAANTGVDRAREEAVRDKPEPESEQS
jgi:hypothetical protein